MDFWKTAKKLIAGKPKTKAQNPDTKEKKQQDVPPHAQRPDYSACAGSG